MLTAFRSFSRSPWAAGLLVVLAVALLVGGGSQFDLLSQLGPRHVVTAGDRHLDQQEFRAEIDRIREQAQQQSGRNVTIEDLVGQGGLAPYLQQKAEQLGFLNWAWNAGIRPGKELVLRQIRQTPQFFDQITGRFSEEQYATALGQVNVTPEMFEAELRDQVTTQHFGSALGAGLRLPKVYGAIVANQALETRDGRWFTVTQAMAGSSPQPTDAQLTTFMNQNAAELRTPELRSGSLVIFANPADADAAVSDAKVTERYNFRKDALSQPEKRTFVVLAAPNRQAADRIAAALRAGQTPEAVASANNIQATPYADTPRAAVADPAIAAAVFGLQANQVSAPIQARVGFAVAKVTGITPARPVTEAEARPQIMQELRAEAARKAVYDRVEAYEKARQEGKTLDQAVAQVGARIIPIPPITQDGKNAQGQPVGAPPQLLEALWKLAKGSESDVTDAGQGQYFVVRLTEIAPAALPPLERIRAPLAQNWMARENARLLNTRADALATRVRGGESLDAVARSVGAPVTARTAISTQDAQSLSQGLARGLLATDKGKVFSSLDATGFIIGVVDKINAAVPALAANIAAQARQQMSAPSLQGLGQTLLKFASGRSKARFDEALARQVLGLSATATPAPGTPAPAKKG